MIVFVACSKSKLKTNKPVKAKDLYTPSAIFCKRMAYAKKITSTDKIFILSAKYGLLKLDDEVEYYDCYLGSANALYKFEWKQKVLKQMKDAGIDFKEEVYFATGSEYWKMLTSSFKNFKVEKDLVEAKLGHGGIGMSLQFYDIMIGEMK